MIAPVSENYMEDVIRLEENRQALRGLHELHRIFHLPGARVAPRQAMRRIIEPVLHILPLRQSPLGVGKLAGSLLEAAGTGRGAGFGVAGDIGHTWMVPDTVEIGLSVREARNVVGLERKRSQGKSAEGDECGACKRKRHAFFSVGRESYHSC